MQKKLFIPPVGTGQYKKKCTSWRSDMSLPSQNLRDTTVCQSKTNAWVTSLETFWRENHPPKLSMASEHHCTSLCEQHCLLKLLHGPGAPVHHTVHWCTGHHLIVWFNLWTIVHQCSTLEFSAPMQSLSALVQCSNAPVRSLNNICYCGNTLYSFWLSMAQNVSVVNFNLLPESEIWHICSLVSFNLLDKLLLQKSAIEFVMTQDLWEWLLLKSLNQCTWVKILPTSSCTADIRLLYSDTVYIQTSDTKSLRPIIRFIRDKKSGTRSDSWVRHWFS